MLCQECNEREAVVTYSTMSGNQIEEKHICQSCLQKHLTEEFPFPVFEDTGLDSVINQIFSMFIGGGQAPQGDKVCPHCQTSLEEFKKTSILGCAHCYEAFEEDLAKIIPRIQGASYHTGARPKDFVPPQKDQPQSQDQEEDETLSKIESLEEDLKKAVAEERYEDAADFRDKIKLLKEGEEG